MFRVHHFALAPSLLALHSPGASSKYCNNNSFDYRDMWEWRCEEYCLEDNTNLGEFVAHF